MVALIGDSYLEGFWVDIADHIDCLLHEKSNGEVDFYSFGTWGAMLSQYLVLSEDVVLNYHPDVIVIFLNEEDARASHYEKNKSVNLCYTVEILPDSGFRLVPPPELTMNRFIPLLLNSATLRYLKTNRKLAFLARGAVTDRNANISESVENPSSEVSIDSSTIFVTEYLLDEYESLGVPIIIVADGPRAPIYRGELEPARYADCVLVQELCESRDNIVFIDLIPHFAEDWVDAGIMFSPEDNPHWNEHGNRVVANAIFQDIMNAI